MPIRSPATPLRGLVKAFIISSVDEEVLGYETSLESIGDMTRERNVIGVGVGPHNQVETVVQSITTRDEKGDVNKKTEGVSMMPPFMIVTKKNSLAPIY